MLEVESTPGPSAAGRIMTPSGNEPATFRLVAQCLNQLRYRVPLRFTWSLDLQDKSVIDIGPDWPVSNCYLLYYGRSFILTMKASGYLQVSLSVYQTYLLTYFIEQSPS